MKPLKFPLVSTLALFALSGLLALYIPLPQVGASSDVMSKIFK
jgi:hypothetical protein